MSTRRRFVAGCAALVALTATLVFGGSLAAHADDGLEIDPTPVTYTGTAMPVVVGTAALDNNGSVHVYFGTPGTPGADLCAAATPDPGTGDWSCTAFVAPGVYTVTAEQGAPIPRVDTETITIRPPAPSVSDPATVAAAGTISLTGDGGVSGATITAVVTTPNEPGLTCTVGPLAADGPWTGCDIPFDAELPPHSTATVSVTQTMNGANSVVTTHDVAVLSDVLQVLAPAEGSSAPWTSTTTVSGVAPALAPTVSIDIDGVPVPECANVAVDGAGDWTCNISTPTEGSHSVQAHQGATTSPLGGFIVTYPAPNVTTPVASSGVIYPGGEAMYDGTASYPGVTILVSTSPFFSSCNVTSTLSAGDPWQCVLSTENAAPGSYDVTVEQQLDGATIGDVWFGTLLLSDALTITSPATGAQIEWTAGGFDVTGETGNTTDPIELWVEDSYAACTIPAPTATWSCPGIVLDPGSYSLYALQNGQPDSVINIDVTVPRPDVDQTGYSYVEGTAFATFSGTTQTYPGADVSVELEVGDGLTRDCTDTSDAAGWSCQIAIDDLADNSYNVAIRQHTEFASSDSVNRQLEILGMGTVSPPLDCTFTPGGFTVSGPYQVNKEIYRLTPAVDTGSGSGGGGGYTLADQGSCSGSTGYHDPSVTVWDDGGSPIAGGECAEGPCSVSGLEAGIYELYYTLSDGDESAEGLGYSHEPFDYLFRVPETPALSTVVSTTNSVVLQGTGTAGDSVRVVRSAGTNLCTTTVTASGTWACQFPKSSDSSARVLAVDPQSGGMSSYSAARSIPIYVAPVVPPLEPSTPPVVPPAQIPAAPPVVPEVPVVPEEPTALVKWFLEFGGDLMGLKPGDSFTLNVSGMPEGTTIEIWMHSTPRLLGTATGTGLPMTLDLTVPMDIENGPHEIEMIGVTPLGTQYFFTSDAMVTGGVAPDASVDEETSGGDDESGAGGTGGPAGSGDRADPAAPSALSGALAPLSAIAANPATIAIAGGLALALLFLVALPTELLNSSLSSNTSRLGRAYGAVDGAMSKAQDWLIQVTRSRGVAAGILVVIVAIIYGFVDPHFGFDVVSVRLVLSLALALFVLTFVASWISGMIIRRAWGAMGVVAMQPSIILFAVVGVIVARILEFSPGFLVGVAIGLELVQATRTVAAKAVFVQLGVVTGLALAAWVVYSLFVPGNDFVGMLFSDTLVAVTAEGLTGALIAVFPLTFLDGRELWEVSKRLWVAAFLIVATAFALLVLPTAIEATDVGDYGTWLLVFAVFGLVSLAVWLVFARAQAKAAKAEGEKVDA